MAPKRASTSSQGSSSTKKAKTSSTINDYNRDYQDSKADVTLISADGLHFKVHSYVLKTASVVFRDMFNIANGCEVTLSDSKIERSRILASFLDICYGRQISLPPQDTKSTLYDHCEHLIKLATKYDSPIALRYLTASIYQWYHGKRLHPYYVMRLGFTLDDPEMIVFAIRNSDNGSWSASTDATEEEKAKERNPVGTLGTVADTNWLCLTAWDLKSFKEIPDDYKFAIFRATHGIIGHTKSSKTDRGKIADGFLQIMKEMGKIQ